MDTDPPRSRLTESIPGTIRPRRHIIQITVEQVPTVTVTANTVDDLAEGATITNTATTWDPWDPYSGGTTPNDTIDEDTDQYDDSTATVPSGDLKVDKEIITSGTKPGDTVIYRLTARNDGPDVQGGITVTEKPGVGLEPGTVTLTDPSIGDVNGLTWTIGTLEPGQEETVTVTATLAGGIAGTDVLNAVTIENPLNPVPSTEQCEPNEDAASDRDQCDVVTITVPEPPVNSGGSNGAANAGGAGAHTGGEADTYGLLASVVAALGGAGLITAWRGRRAVGRKE